MDEIKNIHLADELDWEEIDSYISGSGTVRTYEATHEGKVWQMGIHDFDSDYNPILFIEEA